jgi:hypothetical protein
MFHAVLAESADDRELVIRHVKVLAYENFNAALLLIVLIMQ